MAGSGPTTEIIIRELGPKGDGVGQGPRGRVYVEGGLPGDRLMVRVHRGDDGIARGEILRVMQPSPQRVAPPCVYYDRCGGCTLQHMRVEDYRKWKQDTVRAALEKVNLRPRKWDDPVFVPEATRRRATFAVKKIKSGVIMGYYRRRSKEVTDIETCLVVAPEIMSMRDRLRPLLTGLVQEKRDLDVFIQYAGGAYDVVLTGALGPKGGPDMRTREAVADMARTAGIARIGWRNRDRDEIEILIENAKPVAAFGELRVPLPPGAFLQPTQDGEKALTDAVMALLPEGGKGRYADLFSGCGTFTGPMLARGSVDAYESVDPAVKALTKARGSLPLNVFRRDLFRNPLRREEANRYDAIVFDPPRAGAREQVQALASSKVKCLIGVSCNPATFARDARILCDGGYRLDRLRVVDQFTWSHHVELVAAFTRK